MRLVARTQAQRVIGCRPACMHAECSKFRAAAIRRSGQAVRQAPRPAMAPARAPTHLRKCRGRAGAPNFASPTASRTDSSRCWSCCRQHEAESTRRQAALACTHAAWMGGGYFACKYGLAKRQRMRVCTWAVSRGGPAAAPPCDSAGQSLDVIATSAGPAVCAACMAPGLVCI